MRQRLTDHQKLNLERILRGDGPEQINMSVLGALMRRGLVRIVATKTGREALEEKQETKS